MDWAIVTVIVIFGVAISAMLLWGRSRI